MITQFMAGCGDGREQFLVKRQGEIAADDKYRDRDAKTVE